MSRGVIMSINITTNLLEISLKFTKAWSETVPSFELTWTKKYFSVLLSLSLSPETPPGVQQTPRWKRQALRGAVSPPDQPITGLELRACAQCPFRAHLEASPILGLPKVQLSSAGKPLQWKSNQISRATDA